MRRLLPRLCTLLPFPSLSAPSCSTLLQALPVYPYKVPTSPPHRRHHRLFSSASASMHAAGPLRLELERGRVAQVERLVRGAISKQLQTEGEGRRRGEGTSAASRLKHAGLPIMSPACFSLDATDFSRVESGDGGPGALTTGSASPNQPARQSVQAALVLIKRDQAARWQPPRSTATTGGWSFVMRLRSFRRALYQELDLDWSGLRVQQLCSTRAMGMPIMGEWYPTQRQQQQPPGASLSTVRTLSRSPRASRASSSSSSSCNRQASSSTWCSKSSAKWARQLGFLSSL